MKKALLVSSVLLAAAGCSVDRGELAAMRSEAVVARASLVDAVYLSTGTYVYRTYDGTEESGVRDISVRLRLTFIKADAYQLEEQPYATGLEYEVVVEHVDVVTGQVFSHDTTFFVKTDESGKYAFYDCDSSRRCWNDFKTQMDVSVATGTLTIDNRNIGLVDTDDAKLAFIKVPSR